MRRGYTSIQGAGFLGLRVLGCQAIRFHGLGALGYGLRVVGFRFRV